MSATTAMRKTTRVATSTKIGNSAFEKEPTNSSAPRASEPDELSVEKDSAPTYKFVDRQTGFVDQQAEDRGKEDEIIRIHRGKNPDDEEKAITKFASAKKAVKGNQREDQPHTTSSVNLSAEFAKYWELETDHDLEDVVHTEKNTWTPNAIAMYEILREIASFAHDHPKMDKHHKDYLDYAVACYYGILFYIQILRAKEAAGLLVGEDSSFFRRFLRKYKFEELPVAGPLVPYFYTIVSTLLPDSKYNWIVPDYNTGILSFGSPTDATVAHDLQHWYPGNGACFIQPMVPFMLGILRASIQRNVQNELYDEDAQNNLIHIDGENRFIVRRLEATNAQRIFNMPFQLHAENNTNQSNSFFTQCGVSYPFNADADTLNVAGPKWRRSAFKNFPVTAYPSNHPDDRYTGEDRRRHDLDDRAKVITRLDEFLCMEKSSDLEWFGELIRQAGLHARFFDNAASLSDIPTTGGLETTILCNLRQNVNNRDLLYANTHLGLNTQDGSDNMCWYPETFRGFVADFRTNREGCNRQEILQAMTFGTNATLNVTIDGHRLGSHLNGFRHGAFWLNEEWAATKYVDSGTAGKRMFLGWRTMHQASSAKPTPTGY